MPEKFRIGITADPLLPVPPSGYGGIERIVAFLVHSLVARGHRVTLWASAGSNVPCELEPYGTPERGGLHARLEEMTDVAGALWRRREDFDVIHSFGRLAALTPVLCARVPKIQSYQREITLRNVRVASRLAGRSLLFTSCGTAQRAMASRYGRWVTVPNGASATAYHATAVVPPNAPLVFLGRIERIKGPHTAIEVARRTGHPLVIAGNVPPGHEGFFESEIRPHLFGGQVNYVGPVNDTEKNELLGGAAALLMPVEWEEPFGIVMAEALACGTPVIGLRRGAVPEVIEHGVTGFVCDTAGEMVASVGRIREIARGRCRAAFERRFSDSAVVTAYETCYRDVMEATFA